MKSNHNCLNCKYLEYYTHVNGGKTPRCGVDDRWLGQVEMTMHCYYWKEEEKTDGKREV